LLEYRGLLNSAGSLLAALFSVYRYTICNYCNLYENVAASWIFLQYFKKITSAVLGLSQWPCQFWGCWVDIILILILTAFL